MRRHWQRKPFLVRQAMPGVAAPATRAQLFALAGRDDVESRLVCRDGAKWSVREGPIQRRALPPIARANWTLLVQGLDLHLHAAQDMLSQFRFLPDARLDDLMVSWASDGGGVGPHLDSYDVFLIQVQGQRRWRIGPVLAQADEAFVEGLPLKILRRFEPSQEWLLEPGDMLYLPPRWAHDGVAVGECMTCSVGFRASTSDELARELLGRLADEEASSSPARYSDRGDDATSAPGLIPQRLQDFARQSVQRLLEQPDALACALGESLTEPKPSVWFESGTGPADIDHGVQLALGSRMMYDMQRVYINGEAFSASGRDASAMHRLADLRMLDARACSRLGASAQALLAQWLAQGWLVPRQAKNVSMP